MSVSESASEDRRRSWCTGLIRDSPKYFSNVIMIYDLILKPASDLLKDHGLKASKIQSLQKSPQDFLPRRPVVAIFCVEIPILSLRATDGSVAISKTLIP